MLGALSAEAFRASFGVERVPERVPRCSRFVRRISATCRNRAVREGAFVPGQV